MNSPCQRLMGRPVKGTSPEHFSEPHDTERLPPSRQAAKARRRLPNPSLASWRLGGRKRFFAGPLWLVAVRALLVLTALIPLAAFSQTLPLEALPTETLHNFQSQRGVPLSNVPGTPAGSDGRAPGPGSGSVGTSNQFQGLLSFGGGLGRTNPPPSGGFGAGKIQLFRPRVGHPLVGRSVAYFFGEVIPPPGTDEYGMDLAVPNTTLNPVRPAVDPYEYWLAEPYTSMGHTNAGYYWSPHAEQVYATEPGAIALVWRKAVPSTPVGAPNHVNTVVLGGSTYTIYTNRHVVSSLPAKPPRRMYWTEGPLSLIGKAVSIPTGRVRDIQVVYHSRFPAVTNEFRFEGKQAGPIEITNTLWFDRTLNSIRAYNVEGRVFVELLGDKRGQIAGRDIHEQLGYEIVDLIQRPVPADVTVELGDRIPPYQGQPPAGTPVLFPDPVLNTGPTFAYGHSLAGTALFDYYAIRETQNQNDYQVHWLEEGLEGLLWPYRFVRYDMVWPAEVSRYSHYLRPLVANEAEAKATAVALPAQNAPFIAYQDPLDQPRGKLTESFAYYSFLDAQHPAHRALLQFNSGEHVRFERVFSWLDDSLRLQESGTPAFVGSVATNLNAWIFDGTFNWPDPFVRPRVVQTTVQVGDRIPAPDGEIGGGLDTNYLAGFIQSSQGDHYHPDAYLDPFVSGFDLANHGAIIPVNAVPGKNLIEVWWFRRNQVDASRGFAASYWPAVLGRYTIEWPDDPAEIVLASNDGSGPLDSLQAAGRIYFENDPARPGYNPNEEHALMQGGQAFALRDDLNITTQTNGEYSSHPFVLLEYTAADGKPAVRPFRVRREAPEAGIVFDYERPAGTILQPPMPLPLLGVPFAPKLPGQPRQGLNEEIAAWNVSDSVVTPVSPPFWTLTLNATHGFLPYWPLALQDMAQSPPTLRWFYATEVSDATLDGVISLNRPVALVSPDPAVVQPASASRWRFGIGGESLPSGAEALLAVPGLAMSWSVGITAVETNPPAYVEVDFGGSPPVAATNASTLVLVILVTNATSGAFNQWSLAWNERPAGSAGPSALYASATLEDRKGNTWIYRGPHEGSRPEVFTMQFYYNTLPGFHFPSLPLANQPPVGTVTPYLRPVTPDGEFVGDPVFGNPTSSQSGARNPLSIRYRPVWPDNAPVLLMGETLTTPKRGLPAVRGQTSLQVLYQQSQIEVHPTTGVVIHPDQTSVLLHDPTREKSILFGSAQIPASVRTETARGLIHFPNLPPHLVQRFFLDPNRGVSGALVFKGEFVEASLGESHLLLNVAGSRDAALLRGLCLAEDPGKGAWDAAIAGLATEMERFVENPAQPGSYVAFAPHTTSVGLGHPAEVTDDDVAVDSYALTAIGPATGYVSLIAGNGEAFTPGGEPVSIHVLRVVSQLYRGEVHVVASDNPLSEQLTMQQTVDLAGKAEEYVFDWRITAPVDGQPADIYDKEPQLFTLPAWSHLRHVQDSDSAAAVESVAAERVVQDVSDLVVSVSVISFQSVTQQLDRFRFTLLPGQPHGLSRGDLLVMRSAAGIEVNGTVHDVFPASREVEVRVDPNQAISLTAGEVYQLEERIVPDRPQSILFSRFVVPPGGNLTELWLSLDLATGLGARAYINGALVATAGLGVEDTMAQNPPSDLATPRLQRSFRLPADVMAAALQGPDGSRTNLVAIELKAPAYAGQYQVFRARVEAYASIDQVTQAGSVWLPLDPSQYEDGVRAILGGTADVRSLTDNYLTMRYRPMADPDGWSPWTEPQLAEGWIKRVLAGINPFNQRVSDLFNNTVNTDVSIVAQAGPRWEGDVALSLESVNDYGLIEIYETVLNRGRMLSIGGGINYGPANDALLLAVGYINDLYMLVGNEAAADAANPTIGIGTKDNTYGDIATALFAFRGQLPTLLEEELALLRGRDDFLVPGVETRPVYNRMVWNYTRGIDAGEVIYALNYNILDQNVDGTVDAEDARQLYPQGHGDAYGHYLTALSGYYHLLLDSNFDWVPRSEAVLVLGKPVSVDYQDERKFAAAAAALARTGKQVFDLTWRKDYRSGAGQGWNHYRTTRSSNQRTRHWGIDHWAARTAQGAYFNWIVGNAILPETDPDPAHLDTIQQVDRTSVPELKELPDVVDALQITMDNAESGNTPLGLPENTVPFDLNPNVVVSSDNQTHFEQIYGRALAALNNAVVAFDDAKDVTRLLRSEQDSLADFKTVVDQQELAYTNALIELFGTPYPEDIGPGRTYRTGYAGPDLIHFSYVDNVELAFAGPQGSLLDPADDVQWRIDTQTFTDTWINGTNGVSDFNWIQPARNGPIDGTGLLPEYETNRTLYVEYNLASHGFFRKPATWTGRRASPGRIQQAISDVIKARNAAFTAFYWADAAKYDLDWAIQSFEWKMTSHQQVRSLKESLLAAQIFLDTAKTAWEVTDKILESNKDDVKDISVTVKTTIPKNMIVGVASGGDLTSTVLGSLTAAEKAATKVISIIQQVGFSVIKALESATSTSDKLVEFYQIAPEEWNQELRDATSQIRDAVYGMNNHFMTINQRLQELDDAQRHYLSLLAEGERIQQEREVFRQRAAAVIQGFRTRDAAFRIFRNEKLERYKALFDLAAQYTYMAAQAYDYETGLLGTPQGMEFIQRIVNARALGVIQNGQPQFAGSNTGDPGLSSVLAEMHADWSVIKGRLGFNNPDAYGTTVSLRHENFRITTDEAVWQNVLHVARRENVLSDPDVRRYCLQIDPGNGLSQPGLILEFSTTIDEGLNLFGRPLAPGDHAFSASSFATKIFAAGIALEGYVGMDDPAANGGAVSGSGGSSPSDPDLVFLDPDALSATPYVYLVPVGLDTMRSPPLGDVNDLRTWDVDDVAIPLPFNLGGSDFSTAPLWQSSDSLTEPPFAIRKHQAFRPVSSSGYFDPSIYTTTGGLQRSQYTSNRLIGRSVWNSRWKLVIPGRTLLNDPEEGLDRFIRTVKDIKLHFVTYSYSGN